MCPHCQKLLELCQCCSYAQHMEQMKGIPFVPVPACNYLYRCGICGNRHNAMGDVTRCAHKHLEIMNAVAHCCCGTYVCLSQATLDAHIKGHQRWVTKYKFDIDGIGQYERAYDILNYAVAVYMPHLYQCTMCSFHAPMPFQLRSHVKKHHHQIYHSLQSG